MNLSSAFAAGLAIAMYADSDSSLPRVHRKMRAERPDRPTAVRKRKKIAKARAKRRNR